MDSQVLYALALSTFAGLSTTIGSKGTACRALTPLFVNEVGEG